MRDYAKKKIFHKAASLGLKFWAIWRKIMTDSLKNRQFKVQTFFHNKNQEKYVKIEEKT